MLFLPFRVMYGTAREGRKKRKGLYIMTIRFNAKGAQRKALVKAIADITGADFRYLGVPSLCYEVDYLTIDREGSLIFDDSADSGEIEELLEGLAQRGFIAEETEAATAEESAAREQEAAAQETEAAAPATEGDSGNETATPTLDDSIGLTISFPIAGFDGDAYRKLCGLIDSKAGLIKKALGIDDLTVKVDAERISFPWFTVTPDAPVAKAAMELVAALCRTAKEQTRVTAKPRMVPNEKYAFRCFLLRLGFIGAEHKETRKVLLQNLTGNGAFRDGKKKGATGNEVSE